MIIVSGDCDYPNAGKMQYLINRNPHREYSVIIRTYWRKWVNSGEYDDEINIPAGGKVTLGCTDTGGPNGTEYRREIVGEI